MRKANQVLNSLLGSLANIKSFAKTDPKYNELENSVSSLLKELSQLEKTEQDSLSVLKTKIMSKGTFFAHVKESRNKLKNAVAKDLNIAYEEYWELKNKLKDVLSNQVF